MRPNKLVLLAVFSACASLVSAASLAEMQVVVEPLPVPLGFPFRVTITLRNNTATAISVPARVSADSALRWEDLPAGVLPPTYHWRHRVEATLLAPGGAITYGFDAYSTPHLVPRFCRPGTYTMPVALVLDKAPGNNKSTRYQAVARIEIVPPGESDRAALEYLTAEATKGSAKPNGCLPQEALVECLRFGGGQLLRSFPESSYASFVVYHVSGAGEVTYPAGEIVRCLEASNGSVAQIWVPCERERCPEPLTAIYGADVLRWRDKWLPLVLEHHGDLWFADSLRVLRALDLFRMHRPEEGAALLTAVAKQGRPESATKAAELLGLLRAKGWCK